MLRVRSSQSLLMDKVEGTTARSRRKSKLGSDNLRDFYNSNGIFGSATSSPDDDELFLIGAMDNSHTISFDLQICSRNGKIEDFASLDSGREYKLKPIIQSCFAYTGVVKNKGKWLTIRRLRVATYELNLEDDVEIITSSLDMEVLAFVSHRTHIESRVIDDFLTLFYSYYAFVQLYSPFSINFKRRVSNLVLIQFKILLTNSYYLHYCAATNQLKKWKGK